MLTDFQDAKLTLAESVGLGVGFGLFRHSLNKCLNVRQPRSEMSKVIPVLTKIPSLLTELQKIQPKLEFKEVSSKDFKVLQDSEIIIADFDLLAPHLSNLNKTKWVQGTWAGVDKLMSSVSLKKPPLFPITRFSGEHFGRLMSEYVIANIVNHERNYFKVKENQKDKDWNRETNITYYRAIYDLTIGILGVGHIGNAIGKSLNNLGAKIHALGRRAVTPLESPEYSHIEKYHNNSSITELLRSCDYVINVLPNTEETTRLLDGNVLENCKEKGPVFINIGRGNIISETSLVNALNQKWISGAILDVFETEPLRFVYLVFITPHVSGTSRPQDIAEHFNKNYKLFKQNLPLLAVIDFERGY